MDTPDGSPVLRIGELSRRAGVSDHVCGRGRAATASCSRCARRAASGCTPRRTSRGSAGCRPTSPAGCRPPRRRERCSEEDSGAGADGRAAGPDRVPAAASELPGDLRQALDAFDEPAAQAVLDRLVSDLSLTAVLRDVVLPYLAELGERWERGTASVAQEHFASNLIRGRLAGLARGWGNGHGPRAVLACPPGELHDLALMVFGIVLNRNGWRIDYLGMNTPVEELTRTVDARHPDLVVLAATLPENLEPHAAQLTALAQHAPLALAGAGATPQIAAVVGARLLAGDPVTEAENTQWPR